MIEHQDGLSVPDDRKSPAVPDEGCPPLTHVAPEPLDTGMLERLNERLEILKKEIASELTATVVAEIRHLAEDLRRSGPDSVSRKEACRRIGIGPTKLKGLIARGEILTCVGDPHLIPISEIQRFTRPARHVEKPRKGGRKKAPVYDPVADFDALGQRKRRKS